MIWTDEEHSRVLRTCGPAAAAQLARVEARARDLQGTDAKHWREWREESSRPEEIDAEPPPKLDELALVNSFESDEDRARWLDSPEADLVTLTEANLGPIPEEPTADD